MIYNKRQIHRCDLGKIYENTPLKWGDFYEWIKLATYDGMTVLDAGAGEGQSRNLFQNNKVQYLGVDSCIGSDEWNYDNVVKADIKKLDFIENESVDMVLLLQVLEHLDNPNLALNELTRVLKKGGSFFVSVPQNQSIHQVPFDFYRYTPYGLRFLFEEHGLEIVRIAPQLYGDNSAAIKFCIWALKNTSETATGKINRYVARFLGILVKLLQPIAMILDKNIPRHCAPIGYFVEFKKV